MSGDYKSGKYSGRKSRNFPIHPLLPASRRPASDGREVMEKLEGATIVRIGTTTHRMFEGGGLLIDYRLRGSTQTRRIIFAFNESGMWLEYDGPSGGE
jgi:hypothetical protein